MTFTFESYTPFIKELETELNTPTLDRLHIYPVHNKYYCCGINIYTKTQHHTYSARELPAQVFVRHNGHLTIELYIHEYDYLKHHLQQWGEYVRNRLHAAEHIKNFWETAKEELAAAAWHPDRVGKWLEAGIDVEAM